MKPGDEMHVALWDAVNEYATTCGGNPATHVYGNTPRQRAVAKIEDIIRRVVGTQIATKEAMQAIYDIASARLRSPPDWTTFTEWDLREIARIARDNGAIELTATSTRVGSCICPCHDRPHGPCRCSCEGEAR